MRTTNAAALLARTILAAGGAAALLALALVACDEVYADPVTDPTFGFGTSSGVDSGGFTTPRTPPFRCSKQPNENGSCSRAGAVCEYGDSPDSTCNSLYVCANDATYGTYWAEQSRGQCPGTCPADPTTIVDGAPCEITDRDGGVQSSDEAELQCVTAAAVCACTTGPDGAHAHPRKWVCVPTGFDCPPKRPNLGSFCTGERSCDYGACAFKRGSRMICEDDVWQVEVAQCD